MDKPKRQRATESQLQERIHTAFIMLRQGTSTARIGKYLTETEKVSLKTAERAVAAAKRQMENIGKESLELEFGKIESRIDQLYRDVISSPQKDLELANKLIQSQTRLAQLKANHQCKTAGNREKPHEPTEPTASSEAPLSPELQRAVKRFAQPNPTQPQLQYPCDSD